MKTKAILETVLYAKNLNVTHKFYTDVLGLELYSKSSYYLFFKLEKSMLLIFDKEHTLYQNNRPSHGTLPNTHLAFSMVKNEVHNWKTHLQNKNVKIEKEVSWESGAYSIYFRDPSGNSLELASPDLWNFKL